MMRRLFQFVRVASATVIVTAMISSSFSQTVQPIDSATLLGLRPSPAGLATSKAKGAGSPVPLAGLLNATFMGAPLEPAVVTQVGGIGQSYQEVFCMGDFDGKEDLLADVGMKIDDFSLNQTSSSQNFMLTRSAVSEHIVASGFNENVFYYGDSIGNLYVCATKTVGPQPASKVFTINLPTSLGAFGTLNSDDQIVITGIAVSPVCDLTQFPNVNGAYSVFNNQIGEIVYVAFNDFGSGFRTVGNALVRSGLLAFPVADLPSAAPTPPGTSAPAGFPVTVGGAFGVAFSTYANVAGCAVDDDGSVYLQQVDLQQFTGANIVKITSVDTPPISDSVQGWQDRGLATNGFVILSTLNPVNGNYGISNGPTKQINRATNYSGTSPLFGNISALACAPNNILYAAVARSNNPGDDSATRNTEGPFPSSPIGPTPSMVISFSDVSGALNRFGLNNAAFQPPADYSSTANPSGVVTADFNNDGRSDIAVCDTGSNSVRIYLATPQGTFTSGVPVNVGLAPVAITAGLFDTNGSMDLAVANSTSNTVSILLNNGSGVFSQTSVVPVGTTPMDVKYAVMTTSGVVGLVTANQGSNDVSVALRNGNGTFAAPVNYPAGTAPRALVLNNFDSNSAPDIAVANNVVAPNVNVLLNNGSGVFGAPAAFSAGTNPIGIVSADFNNDTFADLAVANAGSGNVSVLQGNGAGSFAAPTFYPVGSSPGGIALGQIDGVGSQDLVVSSAGGGTISVLISNNDITFQTTQSLPCGPDPHGVATGDFNGDGYTDICTARSSANMLTVLLAQKGVFPAPDGFADAIAAGVSIVPGVNNFKAFVLGNGPDLRSGSSKVFGSTAETLKLDMQIDYTIYSGIMADEQGQVYVISGGTPANQGLNPSPSTGEILVFPDDKPVDRRADFVDLRGDGVPIPVGSDNVGDGVSDRFDHVFYTAPLDGTTLTPTGLAGVSRGFLVYLNRTHNDVAALTQLPNGHPQADDESAGPISFKQFDTTEVVAGGYRNGVPPGFGTGDDSTSGGFEFGFGGISGSCLQNWSDFYLNSNGSVSFGVGDAGFNPTEEGLRTGPPRVAGLWSDLFTSARVSQTGVFPLQALGFAGVNCFKVRWINVPHFGYQSVGSSNTFSIYLYDDGVGQDENSQPPGPLEVAEGPVDSHWVTDAESPMPVPFKPRGTDTARIRFDYGFTNIISASTKDPAIAGYSIGGQLGTNPPGLCGLNLSEEARVADAALFHPGEIGNGTEPTIDEFFNEGSLGTAIGPPVVSMDLRWEGNDPLLAKPVTQGDPNRATVGFYGVTCTPPQAPTPYLIESVPSVTVAPGQTSVADYSVYGLLNTICSASIRARGSDVMPNLSTTICATSAPRAGLSISTVMAMGIDADNNGSLDYVIPLSNVIPQDDSAIVGSFAPSSVPGSPFPVEYGGGGTEFLITTTTVTNGDNNVFGQFTRTTDWPTSFGLRAPIITGVAPPSGTADTSVTLTISGHGFLMPNSLTPKATGVFAVQKGNPSRVVHGQIVSITNDSTLSAEFLFGAANRGIQWLIYVDSAVGPSRNLDTLPSGSPACVLGNELGNQIIFTTTGVPDFTIAIDDNFSTGSSGWGQFGSTSSEQSTQYDAADTALLGQIGSDVGSNYRIIGWITDATNVMKYSAVGSGRFVRAKFYIFASNQTGAALNQIPNFRMRVANRFAVTSILTVSNHNAADPEATNLAQDIRPSTAPASPSLYRVDLDPIDVPQLVNNPATEGFLRAFEVYEAEPQANGNIGLAESILGSYAALPDSSTTVAVTQNGLIKRYVTSGTGGGDFGTGNIGSSNSSGVVVKYHNGVLEGTGPQPSFTVASSGVTLETLTVESDRLGIAAFDVFNDTGDQANHLTRARVEPGKQYRVRFHATSTLASNIQALVRFRARTIKFQYTASMEVGGATGASVQSNTIAAQALPGVGNQIPTFDRISPSENGGFYNVMMVTPMNSDIEASQPNLAAQDGPGVDTAPGNNSKSRRDLQFGFDVIDTFSAQPTSGNEVGEMIVDRVEIEKYDLVPD